MKQSGENKGVRGKVMGMCGMSSNEITIYDKHAVNSTAYRLQQSKTSVIMQGSFTSNSADHSV